MRLRTISRLSSAVGQPPNQRRGLRILTAATLLVSVALQGVSPHPLQAASAPSAAIEQARDAYARLPLVFVPNQGQTDEQVRYVAQAQGAAVFLTPTEAVLALSPAAATLPLSLPGERAGERGHGLVLRMQFADGGNVQPVAADALSGKVNYLNGDGERAGLPTFSRVRYQNVVPGVDLGFSGTAGRLHTTVTVQPGADLSALAFRYEGADRVEVDAAGALVLHTAGGELRSPRPVAYQEIAGEQRPVEARYVLYGDGRIGFGLGPHDPAGWVQMEPELVYATYLGGSSDDFGQGIAVDAWGHAYVAGRTTSNDFPVTAGSFQTFNAGGQDAFVTKLSKDGSAQVYSTYLGGSSADQARAIAVDGWGHAYVTGRTSSTNFPVTAFAFQPRRAGQDDVFVTKLSKDGSALLYSTYLGGRFDDDGYGIAVDRWGKAYVTGEVNSDDFPTTPGAFQPDDPDGSFIRDAFVTKLDQKGTGLVYSTYLGGSNVDNARGIAVDEWGHAYVTGRTLSADFPTEDPFQPQLQGSTDAFVTKFNVSGSDLVYSTYLGGTGGEEGQGIAVAGWGNAYVTGFTGSADFPTENAFQPNPGGNGDAFVTKFTADGTELVYSTYLGGTGGDVGRGVAVDPWGKASVTGNTNSTDFPTKNAFDTTCGTGTDQFCDFASDAFVTKFTPDGTALVYSTYLGGSGQDDGLAIAVDKRGSAYVTGFTNSPDFPTTPGAFQENPGGAVDAFAAKIGQDGGCDKAWSKHGQCSGGY